MKKIIQTSFLLVLPFLSLNAQTWQQLSMPTSKEIVSSSFISDGEGWIGTINNGPYAVIYHTADSGTTWHSDTINGASAGASYVEFVNGQRGYAVVNGLGYRTTDGTTWTPMNLPGTPYYEPYFLNADTGFISGTSYKLFKTTDGGDSWSVHALDGAYNASRMAFYDDAHGAACEYKGYIDATDDGGDSWYNINDGGLWSYFYSVTYTPSYQLYYTGYTDEIGDYTVWISAPNGYSSDEIGDLFDIRAYSDDTIYAAGMDGQLVYTEDGSQTWNELNLCNLFNIPPKKFNVLDGFHTLYVFGEGGRCFKNSGHCTLYPQYTYSINELEVQFADQTTDATNWNWDFGDGTTSTLPDPMHVYADDGTYHVCLVASNDTCEAGYSGCEDILICTSNASVNIPGSLDTSFNSDGIAAIQFNGYYNYCPSLAVQADHKVVGMNFGFGGEIIRYQLNGLPDSTFGSNGIVELPEDYCGKVIRVDTANKILLAGSNIPGSISLTRFNSDGTIDPSFQSPVISNDNLISMLIQPDGKILVLSSKLFGSTYTTHITRLNSNGTIDNTFSGDGVAELASSDFYFSTNTYGGIDVQADGKIVIAGALTNPNNKIAVARMNADGTMDLTFDGDGIAEADLSPVDYADIATDLVVQPDGKIVVAGNSSPHAVVLRYQQDGSLDPSFGTNGVFEATTDTVFTLASAVTLQPDGKIIFCGTTYFPTSPWKAILVKLNTDGSYDSSFGNNGLVRTSLNCTQTVGLDVAIDSDKIYTGGGGNSNISAQFCIFRYNNECFAPVADFSDVANGSSLQFSDETTDASSWQWDFGDGSTSTDQHPSHTYLLPGTYEVCLIAGNTCGDDTLCQTVTIIATGIAEQQGGALFLEVSPNPFSNYAAIRFSLEKKQSVKIELCDLQGRKIQTIAEGDFEAGDHQLELNGNDLLKGLYFLQLQTSTSIITGKLIIQ